MSGDWKTAWVRGGKVTDLTWIGKDVLAWCCGMHVVFFHTVQKRVLLHCCSQPSAGEGASCLSGHPTLSLFAYSEKAVNPRILIYHFPSMDKVSECAKGCPNGHYLATAFTVHDYIVTLDSYPHFQLTVWSWRTGEKVIAVNSPVLDAEGQALKATTSGRTFVAQLGRDSGKLYVWELNVAAKTVIFEESQIILPPHSTSGRAYPYWVDWSPDPLEPLLAVTDRDSHVYLSNRDGTNVYRVALSTRCTICPDYQPPSVCWYRGGLILKTTYCQIKYYRKTEPNAAWRKEWYMKIDAKPYILTSHPVRSDRVFYYTFEGYLTQISFPDGSGEPTTVDRLFYGGIARFVDFVYPWGHHLVTSDDGKQILVLDSYVGNQVGRTDLHLTGDILCMISHPDLPLIAASTATGEFLLVSLIEPENPQVIVHFHLQREELDRLKFSQSGRYVVAAQSSTGHCFCLNVPRAKRAMVVGRLEAKRQIADVVLYDVRGYVKLFVLLVSSKIAAVGHQILVFDLPAGQHRFIEPNYVIETVNSYRYLCYGPGSPSTLVGTPYLSKHLQILGVQNWKELTLLNAMTSGHQLRKARLHTDRRWLTTAGVDGIVLVRGKTLRTCVAALMPHHRRDFGAVKAIAKASGDLIISLGYDGSIVASKLTKSEEGNHRELRELYRRGSEEYEKRRKKIIADYGALEQVVVDMLKMSQQDFAPPEERKGKTWVEWKQEKKMEEQTREYAARKNKILADFATLKAKVVQLLNDNETCPEIERLPVAAFDLDKVTREQRMKTAKDEREDVRLELESNCASMDRVTQWIKSTFWDSQKLMGQSILAIFGSTEVTNYPFAAMHPHAKDYLEWARFSKCIVRSLVEGETFCPWNPYTSSQLELELNKRAKLYRADERRRIDALLDDDEEDVEVDPEELEDQRAKEGMTTYRYIEQSANFFFQFESYGYVQMLLDKRHLADDSFKLRAHFNKLFNEVYAVKEREMALVRERNERIRYIDSELKLMFDQSVPEMSLDPEWRRAEKPETILKVLDHEVEARPYISPSQQDILDRQAAEAERQRLLLLADDFREKALIAMMDGVLEVRWEDVIKKDVPVPNCALTKSPDQYTPEDVLAIQQYEKDVDFLARERARYKRILEADFVKVSAVLKEGVEKFNAKLEDLFQVRMKIEAAVQQLSLRYIRSCLRNMYKVDAFGRDDAIRRDISEKQDHQTTLHEQLRAFQNVVAELRAQQEGLAARDKAHERKFNAEFPGTSKAIVELLQRQYKRRPRGPSKTTTASELIDLGRCIPTTARPAYLAAESAEYLRGLEALDVRPATLPQSVDAAHWEHLVRIRRQKVDVELRTKAVLAEISNAESTVALFNEKIVRSKNDVEALGEELAKLRRDGQDFEFDVELQLVLKMGQVEIQPSGSRSRDTSGAIFVPRGEVELVNEAILATGAEKLSSMNRTSNFRRGTLFREWEHRCYKMKIEDLERELRCVEDVPVTREIQAFLRRRTAGLREDKTPQQLEREMDAMRKTFEKRLRNWVIKLEDTEGKIERTRRSNAALDKKITEMNVARCEMELRRDPIAEERQREYLDRRMRVVVQRSNLIRKLQDNYGELLILQTEYELLRLRRYPAFKFFKTLDDDGKKKGAC